MRIGIDARLINETGVGRYTQNLIAELGALDDNNSYVLFVNHDVPVPNSRWQKRIVKIPWHSFAEQLFMPAIFCREHLDLLHVPYFNVPIFYPGKMVVTIHDLTILHFDTGKASTRSFFFYKIRRLGYMIALRVALSRAKKVIAVSQTTKREILDHFDVPPDRIEVIYEG